MQVTSTMKMLAAQLDITGKVRSFHRAFGHPESDTPKEVSPEQAFLRARLVMEEAAELCAAMGCNVTVLLSHDLVPTSDGNLIKFEHYPEGKQNMVQIADGTADLAYVTSGTNVAYGIPDAIIFDIVHYLGNMRKLGPDGKPIVRADGKVMKPEGWTPPDEHIRKALIEYGWVPPNA